MSLTRHEPGIDLWLALGSIGVALMDSLDELITSGHMMPALALKILQQASSFAVSWPKRLDSLLKTGGRRPQFDKSASNALQHNLKSTKCTTKGSLKSYNNCDDVRHFQMSLLSSALTLLDKQVWTFVLNNATFRLEDQTIGPLERVRIVACRGDSGPPGGTNAKDGGGKQ